MCPVGPHPGPRAVVADKLVRIFRTHAEDIISRCAGVRPPSVPVCAPVSAADPRPAPRACTESRLLARPGRPASLRCPAPPLAPRTPFPTCVRCAPGLHCLPPAQGGGLVAVHRPASLRRAPTTVQADGLAHAEPEARRAVPEAGRRSPARERGEAGRRPRAVCERHLDAQAGASRSAKADQGGEVGRVPPCAWAHAAHSHA